MSTHTPFTWNKATFSVQLARIRQVLTILAIVVSLVGMNPTPVKAASPVTFAAFGDYGSAGANELAVANMVKAWNPDFMITTGDNSYGSTAIDTNIGQYYSDYIGNYTGSYGSGSLTNRFFPSMGNHDYTDGGQSTAYFNYFTLPSNERYFDFVQGPVHFFVIDSNPSGTGSAPGDGRSPTSTQGTWLQTQLAASTSPWKIVYFHHPPFSSSSSHGSDPAMQWPFEAWGATAVMNGHDHTYERIMRDDNSDTTDMPYFVTGAGGRSLYNFGTPVTGSAVRYNANYGSMRVQASDASITFEFWSVAGGGTLIDTYTITNNTNNLTCEDFDTGWTDGAFIDNADWYSNNGPTIEQGEGVASSWGVSPSGNIFIWKTQPFSWSDAAFTSATFQLDFETDGSAQFDDDRVGWQTSNTDVNSNFIFGVQMDNSGGNRRIEGYWDHVYSSGDDDGRPEIVNLESAGLTANTWYRLVADFTKLTNTSAKIDVELWLLDGSGNPVSLTASGSLPDTSLLGAASPNASPAAEYFTTTNLYPAFKNHSGAPANADNPCYQLILGTPPTNVSVRVNLGTDDAEQRISNGVMDLTSSDLELIRDSASGGFDQIVGMRFQDVQVPVGATIQSAYIEFETDETTNINPSNLSIYGQAADSPTTFTDTASNISTRPLTTASAAWSPGDWNAVSEKHQTSDLSAVVQEIVGRGGWTSGNAMAFIVQGSGQRVAESFEGESANAPLLVINYTVSTEPTINVTGVPLTAFSSSPGSPSAEQSYTVSGSNLTGNIVITPPADFQVSTSSGSGFGTSVTLTQSGGTVAATTIYARFNRATEGSSNGDISHTSTGATTQNVAVSGTAAIPPSTGDVIISAFQSWNSVTGQNPAEFVELFNTTDKIISLENLQLISRVDGTNDGTVNVDWQLPSNLLNGKSIAPHSFFLIAEAGVAAPGGVHDLETDMDLATGEGGSSERAISLEMVIAGVHMDYVLYGRHDGTDLPLDIPLGDISFDGSSWPRSEVIRNTQGSTSYLEGLVSRESAADLYAGYDVAGYYTDENTLGDGFPNGVWYSPHSDTYSSYQARNSTSAAVLSPAATDTTVGHFNAGTLGGCLVDAGVGDGALKLNLPTTSCVFESRIHDAGALVEWTTLTSTETLPAGTSVSFDARTGNTTSPDASWTNWQAASGTLTNPGSQYIQYRAMLSTTDSGQTPVLEDVTINFASGDISVLNTPDGTLTSWDGAFDWTGVNSATWYLLEVYTPGGAQLYRKWHTSAEANCSAGTACSLIPTDLSLGNGAYQWRVMDYGAYGYGIWPYFKSFSLNGACYTLTTNVSPAGSGTVNAPTQSCAGGYLAGTVVQLTAVPGTGYAFSSWSGAASGTGNPVSVTMDANKSVTANMRGNTPLTPTGTLTNWDHAFSWTGLSDATWYLLEVQTSGGTQVFRKWYTSAQTNCSGGTACSVTPAGLSLGNGDYKWRVMDYGAYGYGLNSVFKNFSLNAACYTLTTNVSPGGGGTVNTPTQTCAGGYTAGSVIQVTAVPNAGYLFDTWSGAASGTNNPVSVTMDGNKSVTANFKATVVLLAPSGTLTSWNNTFSWTGLSNATWYLLEVYTSGGTQVHRKWYTSAQTGCSGGTACSVVPPETAGLGNGDYKWRILDYGAYGYGTWTAYTNFTLNQ